MKVKLRIGILLTVMIGLFGYWLFNTKPAKRIINSQEYSRLAEYGRYSCLTTNYGQPERIIEELKSDEFLKVVSRLSRVPVSLLKENRIRLRNGYIEMNTADFSCMEALKADKYYSTYVGLRMGGFSVPYTVEFFNIKDEIFPKPPDIEMICKKYPWVNPNRLIQEKAQVSKRSSDRSSNAFDVGLAYVLDDPPLKRKYMFWISGEETNWHVRLDNHVFNDKGENVGYDKNIRATFD